MVTKKICLSLAFLVIGVLSCVQPYSVTPTETPYPSPLPSPRPYETPTMSISELAYLMAQKELESKMEMQRLEIQSTGTAFIIGVTQTNVQQRIDMAATQSRDTAIAETAAANQMATTTSAAKTQVITDITLTAIPTNAALTATKIAGVIIVDNNNVEASSLDLEKKRDTNKISWQFPILSVLCILAMFGLYVWRTTRWNTVLDGSGEFQALGFDDRLIIPQLMTGPVLEMGANVSVPVLADVGTQKEVTINNQRINALKALSEVSPQSGYQSYQGYFNQAPQNEFDVINAEAIPPGMDEDDISSLDKDWNEAVNG